MRHDESYKAVYRVLSALQQLMSGYETDSFAGAKEWFKHLDFERAELVPTEQMVAQRSNDREVCAGNPSHARPDSIATPSARARKVDPLLGIVATMSRSKAASRVAGGLGRGCRSSIPRNKRMREPTQVLKASRDVAQLR